MQLYKKMEVGPPKSFYRKRFQTTLSCCILRGMVVSVREKVSYKISGEVQGDEAIKPLLKCRKRIDEIKTEEKSLLRDKFSGNLFTG